MRETYKPENTVMLYNPLSSDLNAMRQSLLFGGLETIAYNINRKNNSLKLYEFGKAYTFHKKEGEGWVDVDDIRGDFASGEFFNQQCSPFQRINHNVGIRSPFKAEGSVGAQTVAPGCFAYEYGVETGAFQEYVLCIFCDAALNSAE